MDLLLNDLSLHGQFPNARAFREAIVRIMAIREIAHKYSRRLYSHRNIINSRINSGATMFDALRSFPTDERRAVIQWLTKRGPFWEDAAEHNRNHYLECDGDVVTETAIGEAAFCVLSGIERGLVSFTPSDWECSPVNVRLVSDISTDVAIPNYLHTLEVEAALQLVEPPIASWHQLDIAVRRRFQKLTFSTSCFSYLEGHPFSEGVVSRILSRLDVLNRLVSAVDDSGRRTQEGHRLYQQHFTGDRAWFSDESATNRNRFRNELTFPHPEQPGEYLFCSWHGKINNPPFRIHFTWPVLPGVPMYVVYVGWKRTV